MRNGSEEEGRNTDCLILKFRTDLKESRTDSATQYSVSDIWTDGATQYSVSDIWKSYLRVKQKRDSSVSTGYGLDDGGMAIKFYATSTPSGGLPQEYGAVAKS